MRLSEVVEALLAAIPGLREDATAFRDAWEGDPPETLLMAAIGNAYVRDAHLASEPARCEFFRVVEAALRDADDHVKDVVATGLLEAIVSACERRGMERSVVLGAYLGPLGNAYLRAWDEFCGL